MDEPVEAIVESWSHSAMSSSSSAWKSGTTKDYSAHDGSSSFNDEHRTRSLPNIIGRFRRRSSSSES